jgi:ABC-type uncharacterized transport system auxiliary subunit
MRALITASWLMVSGCALLGGSDSIELRYFTPEALSSPGDGGRVAGAAPAEVQLRLGRVDAASYLREPIAFRDASSEIGFYRKLRWAEVPDAYVRRGLARALFEQHGVREIVSGTGPSLEVELHAFEELRAPRHAARIALTWRLRDGRHVVAQRTVTVERPIGAAGTDPSDAIVGAMAEALRETVDRVATEVIAALERDRQARPPGTAALP